MNNLPLINSTIGPINVSFALNISPQEMRKLTQCEKIQLLRMIHSEYMRSNENFYEDE